MDSVHFSSKSVVYSTPQNLFDSLNREFHFDLDPCALPDNAKCAKFFTPEIDGLMQDWSGHCVFCNPPYGKSLPQWVKKCFLESRKPNTKVVLLIPARTDTNYFQDLILPYCDIRWLRGRLHFNNSKSPAPFPFVICIFK